MSQKGDSGIAYKTGTSMAAPFVTGVVAAYLETHPVRLVDMAVCSNVRLQWLTTHAACDFSMIPTILHVPPAVLQIYACTLAICASMGHHGPCEWFAPMLAMSMQGASPDEVQQKLYQKAMRGSVGDDPQGFATMYPSQFPDLLDISSTPNRLLQANLTGQVRHASRYKNCTVHMLSTALGPLPLPKTC